MVKVNGRCLHVYGYAKDLSTGGIKLRTFTTCLNYPIEVGEKVELEFRLPGKDSDIRCAGELVWNQSIPGDSFKAVLQGVRFTEIDPAHRHEIESWVRELI